MAGGDGLVAQRDLPVGGQAVLEGVMMRGVATWAVAVRRPLPEEVHGADGVDPGTGAHGEIEVQSFPLTSLLRRHRVLRLPVLRGVVALGESMAIGIRALGIAANAQVADEDGGEISGPMWAGTIVLAVAFAVGLFFVIPVGLTSLIKDQLDSSVLSGSSRGSCGRRSSLAI